MIKNIAGGALIGVSLFLHFAMRGNDPSVPKWFIRRMQGVSIVMLIAGLAVTFI